MKDGGGERDGAAETKRGERHGGSGREIDELTRTRSLGF